MREYTGKFKVGDIVNCTDKSIDGYEDWQNAKVVEVDTNFKSFPYTLTCERYGAERGLFSENELEFAT